MNYLKEKKINSNKMKSLLIEEKKVNEKISKSEMKVKNNNNFHFPSLKSCGSSSSLKDFNKKPIINTFSGKRKKIKIYSKIILY